MLRLVLALNALALAAGCSEAGSPPHAAGGTAGAPVVEPSVELGVPTGDDGLGFLALEDGAELRLQTFGQGGTHVLVAVRCLGFDKRAFVSATLRNVATGVEVEEPSPVRPQLLYCHDAGVCDLVPYLVHASGLTKTDQEKAGLIVRLTVEVHDDAGTMAQTSLDAVLSTADL